jgi:hypothetical protein
VTLRARWVTLRARWVTLRARWVTLRARWVTLRARWVTLQRFPQTLAAGARLLRATRDPLQAAWHVVAAAGQDDYVGSSAETLVEATDLTAGLGPQSMTLDAFMQLCRGLFSDPAAGGLTDERSRHTTGARACAWTGRERERGREGTHLLGPGQLAPQERHAHGGRRMRRQRQRRWNRCAQKVKREVVRE